MKLSFLVFIGIIFGCAQETSFSGTSIGTEADMSLYVNQFNQDLAKIGYPPIDTKEVKFYIWSKESENLSDAGGLCSIGSDGVKKISVVNSVSYFSWFTYYSIIHELGHCVYKKPHVDGFASIMNTRQNMVIYEEFRHESKRLEYLREMLTQ